MTIHPIFRNLCENAKSYFISQGSYETAWLNCRRVDWMLEFLTYINYRNDKALRLFACKCACDTPVSGGGVIWNRLDDYSKYIIESAILYCFDKINSDELEDRYSKFNDVPMCDVAYGHAYLAAVEVSSQSVAYGFSGNSIYSESRRAQASFLRQFVKWREVKKCLIKRGVL